MGSPCDDSHCSRSDVREVDRGCLNLGGLTDRESGAWVSDGVARGVIVKCVFSQLRGWRTGRETDARLLGLMAEALGDLRTGRVYNSLSFAMNLYSNVVRYTIIGYLSYFRVSA